MPPILLLKLTLAPVLVAAASLAGRRFGPRVGGWLIGFPVVAGPVLWFYAQEQGSAFAARAATGTALGVVSLAVFLVVYVWSALRWSWGASLVLGWVGFGSSTLLLVRVPGVDQLPWWAALLAAFVALAAARASFPRLPARPARPRGRPDLIWRLLATALLVLTLTALADVLGPELSGLVTPFPVATTILVVFAQRESGPGGVLAVMEGYVPSLYSFVSFCAALSFALERWTPVPAFLAALLVSLLCQTLVLGLVSRRPAPGTGP